MNEKQGERFDHQIRQVLDILPDAPPPGSTFDAGKLWEQLRPELNATPVTQKRVVGWWWAVAASVVALLVGWFWWTGDAVEHSPMVVKTQSAPSPTHSGIVPRPQVVSTQPALAPKAVRWPVRTQPEDARPPTENPKIVVDPVSEVAPQPAEQQLITSKSVNLTTTADPQKPTLAVAPKRRFRVVHENELPAEDEAYQVRSRAGQFVRLGTGGQQLTAGPDEDLPQLRVPLSRKPIQ